MNDSEDFECNVTPILKSRKFVFDGLYISVRQNHGIANSFNEEVSVKATADAAITIVAERSDFVCHDLVLHLLHKGVARTNRHIHS